MADNVIPSSGRVLWFGTNASIPANWTRDTNYDDTFFQLTSTNDAGTTGGSTTHTPTVTNHTDTWPSHVHAVSAGNSSGTTTGGTSGFSANTLAVPHTHSASNSASATLTVTGASVVTLDAASSIPPSITGIFIKPNDASQLIPIDAVAFTDSDLSLADWKITDGANSTVNLSDKFILGATTGSDGGSSAGSATHTHTDSTGHTPVLADHSHGAANSSSNLAGALTTAGVVNTVATQAHVHSVSLDSKSVSATAFNLNVASVSNEPAYVQLAALQNKGASASTPAGIIIIYEGIKTSIPPRWEYVLIGDYQIKVTTTYANILQGVFGANTEIHTIGDHFHTQNHNHTSTAGTGAGNQLNVAVTSRTVDTHTHTWTIGNDTTNSTTISGLTTNSTDKRYKYRKCILIRSLNTTGVTVNIAGGNIL